MSRSQGKLNVFYSLMVVCGYIGRLVSCIKMSQDTISVYTLKASDTPMVYHTLALIHFTLTHTGKAPSLQKQRQCDNWCVSVVQIVLGVCQCCLVKNSVCLCIIKNNDWSFLKGNISVLWAYFRYSLCSISSSVRDAAHTDCRQTELAWNCRVTAVHQYSSEHNAHSLPTRWPCVCVCIWVYLSVCVVCTF